MDTLQVDRFICRAQARALIAMPVILIFVFVMHFRRASDFTHFKLQYQPRDPREVVSMLIAAGNHWPMIHDPHVLAYLSLPLFLLCAFGLYRIGRTVRPLFAALSLAVTATGTVFMGGLFGMWTAFYRGLGGVDPQFLDGAVATFAAQTSPQGAFQLTTVLSRLALVGLALQMAAFGMTGIVPNLAVAAAVVGAALVVVFADLDNWMLIGAALILSGFIPVARRLLESSRSTPA